MFPFYGSAGGHVDGELAGRPFAVSTLNVAPSSQLKHHQRPSFQRQSSWPPAYAPTVANLNQTSLLSQANGCEISTTTATTITANQHLAHQAAVLVASGCDNQTSAALAEQATLDAAHLTGVRYNETNFSEFEQVWLVKSWQEVLLRVTFVVPILLLGILGNLTIIYSICKFKRFRTKPTNIFILNMATADLLTTIVCPLAALFTNIYQFYVLGSFMCRLEGFIKITCLLLSAYSLIVLSLDWLLSVVRPFRQPMSVRRTWFTIASIWFVSVLMASPLLVWRHLRQRQWRDLLEVWCCELIQYTKYYWLGITFFLIYLPTLIMTIVLVCILAQMDRFEAKLRRARGDQLDNQQQQQHRRRPFGELRFNSATPTTSNSALASAAATGAASSVSASPSGQQQLELQPRPQPGQCRRPQSHATKSINMKYRRRIMKILFTYLLTSILCWTPLVLTITYRHFRSEPVPAAWFFELAFFAQLSASLSSALNPIIFGFLSQPFRQIVTKSWMFRLIYKLRDNSNAAQPELRHSPHNNNNNNRQANHAKPIPMNPRGAKYLLAPPTGQRALQSASPATAGVSSRRASSYSRTSRDPFASPADEPRLTIETTTNLEFQERPRARDKPLQTVHLKRVSFQEAPDEARGLRLSATLAGGGGGEDNAAYDPAGDRRAP